MKKTILNIAIAVAAFALPTTAMAQSEIATENYQPMEQTAPEKTSTSEKVKAAVSKAGEKVAGVAGTIAGTAVSVGKKAGNVFKDAFSGNDDEPSVCPCRCNKPIKQQSCCCQCGNNCKPAKADCNQPKTDCRHHHQHSK